MRWKKVAFQLFVYRMSRKKPEMIRKFLLGELRKELGPDYDIDTHFTPNYKPWDQRLCASRDGDLFEAIREERVELVTDHIDHFNEAGIVLKSGKQLEADIVVLATGLNLKFAGGIAYAIDGKELDFREHYTYRGMMFSDVPNMAFTVGYTNSSWTLKADLVSAYVCRILNELECTGSDYAVPRIKGHLGEAPLLDFDAGYVLRSRDQMPKQGDRFPWKMHMNYIRDFISMRMGRLDKKELELG
jgi:cation diffusion facilitator CzcD-associated flavoprotein CzcO